MASVVDVGATVVDDDGEVDRGTEVLVVSKFVRVVASGSVDVVSAPDSGNEAEHPARTTAQQAPAITERNTATSTHIMSHHVNGAPTANDNSPQPDTSLTAAAAHIGTYGWWVLVDMSGWAADDV